MHWIRVILQNIRKCAWLDLKRERSTADIASDRKTGTCMKLDLLIVEINIKNYKTT